MTKTKKLSMFIFSLLLVLTSFLFVACGNNDYSLTSLTVSQDVVEVYVGEQKSIVFTIENPVSSMDKGLSFTLSNPKVCSVEMIANNDYSTTYMITGLRGGNSNLDVSTIEGGKTTSVSISVKQYSDKIESGSNSLYLSPNSSLTPSSADFVFMEESTERQLNYYFYGKVKEDNKLVLEDLMKDNNLINNFVSIELLNYQNQYYLIFTDGENNFYTIDSGTIVIGSENTKYQFVKVEKNEEGIYVFDTNKVSPVTPGEKFTFLANYVNDLDETIFCERSFYVLLDIDFDSISYDYGYQIVNMNYIPGTESSYKIDDIDRSVITLIPDYISAIENGVFIGEKAQFLTAYLEVTIQSSNELLLMKSKAENDSVINSTLIGTIVIGDTKTYYFQVNSNTGDIAKTNFNVTFYYDGFQNSNDNNVNYTYSIPVEVKVIPKNLHINNVDLNEINKEFIFYNSYAGDSFGWQSFQFSVVPTSAEYEYLLIDLTDSGLQLKYKNTVYSNEIVKITNLKDIVFIKGIQGTEITEVVKKLPVELKFNIIKEDYMSTSINYKIVKGATKLDYKTEEFKENIYIDVNSSEPLQFKDLFADAEFSQINFDLTSGNDIVDFSYDKDNPYILEGNDYYLNFNIEPKQKGVATYTISIDNGKQISITITVLESLNDISVKTINEQRIINNTIITPATEDTPASTMFYVLNKNNNGYFDISVISNNDENSTAIRSIEIKLTSQVVQLGEAQNNNKNFNVYLKQNGSGQIELTIYGYQINNFTRIEISKLYVIKIVSYNFVENLSIFKIQDGMGDYSSNTKASYGYVYSNTNRSDVRTLKLTASVQNTNAYLFYNPATENYIEDSFSLEYVYWESALDSIKIYKNGKKVDKMYYSASQTNVYTLGSIGTFDTSSMTFNAYSNYTSSSIILIAHVRQYGFTYSFTVNIKIYEYQEVKAITLQSSLIDNTLEFSTLLREQSLIAYATNSQEATNPEIVAIFTGGKITIDENTYSMFDPFTKDNYIESNKKYQITLKVNEEFIKYAETYTETMRGTLSLVAADWLDSAGNIINQYAEKVKEITVNFANGTEKNRFTIQNASEFLAIKDNLSAHYKINTTVDLSLISNQLPLGELKGSIIGVNEYAKVTGIEITNSIDETVNDDLVNHYYGIFSKISSGAYINYISFEGKINIGDNDNKQENVYIGLIAGINNGSLINIGVTLNTSNIYFTSGNVGGVVGQNSGLILQDFTLFEDDESTTRSKEFDEVVEVELNGVVKKTYLYTNLTPKILIYMNDFMNVYYTNINDINHYNRIGGVAGYNDGIIKKIDSLSKTYSSYTNYMAYSLIKATPDKTNILNSSFIGGLVGENKSTSISVGESFELSGVIQGGYNKFENQTLTYTPYLQYKTVDDAAIENSYQAGQGIIVGGEIWGYGYIGGVVGYYSELIKNIALTGITARTFVRGQTIGESNPSVAVISNIDALVGATTTSAFAIQAVDDGKTGEESSMVIIYARELFNTNYLTDSDYIAFGNKNPGIDVMKGLNDEESGKYVNVLTYLSSRRSMIIPDDDNYITIEYSNKEIYYGDFVVVALNNSVYNVVAQAFFKKGNEKDLSVSEAFNNKMISESDSDNKYQIFYMYYFKVGSVAGDVDITEAQKSLDTYLNKVSYSNKSNSLYPFIVNGEISFVSKTKDVLTIDQNGLITVKKTGLAQISATSVLNSNNALNFYIYVVNYFNSESSEDDNNKKNSILYPIESTSSVAMDDSTIELRGNESSSVYVLPRYDADIVLSEESSFISDKNGLVSLNGIVFNLIGNSNITANVSEEDGLDISVVGSTITFRKNSKTEQKIYSLTINPVLQLTITEGLNDYVFYSKINKELNNIKVDYKYGALSLDNVNYNEVTIYTSKIVKDEIKITSTDNNIDNEKPKYYIVDFNNENLQGDISGLNYLCSEGDALFNVDFKSKDGKEPDDFGNYDYVYTMTISINTNSQLYKNRYQNNIYGVYTLNIQSGTNSAISTTIQIFFEKTNVNSVVIDNYTSLTEANSNGSLPSVSDYAFPGESGLLSITISPPDSDFDYILIENDESNSNDGNASANFSFLARNNNTTIGDTGSVKKLFDQKNISGSSTSKGIKLTLDDIISVYNQTKDGKNIYEVYNGVIYIQYDMGSLNVVDGSVSKIKISFVKDGNIIYSVDKNLTIKLQNFVAVEIEDKEMSSYNQGGYYASYNLARGLKYKLNINTYGFNVDNVELSLSNNNIASIIQENGEYYLQITSGTINYQGENIFDINVLATQSDGDIVREASSKTNIVVNEYILNFNAMDMINTDLISGMDDGIINIQVGTKTTFAVDLFDYIEYDYTNNEILQEINEFMIDLAKNGQWTVYTNLISDVQPDYSAAKDEDKFNSTERKLYNMGYENGLAFTGSNYYFEYNGLDIIPSKTHNPSDRFYYFTFQTAYKIENGIYQYDEPNGDTNKAQTIKTTFVLNVFTSSSEESPIPLYDYNDFINMQEGGYYILLNDITLPNKTSDDGTTLAFTPITGNFASFDGNGHTINLAGEYNMGNLINIGVFSSLSENSIIKNVNVNFTAATDGSDFNTDQSDKTYALEGLRTVKFVTTSDRFIFGGLVAENSGIITNCQIYTDKNQSTDYYITVKADNALNSNSYIGGLAGTNNGYITNCRVSINVKSPYNTAGVVAENYGKVAASYFKGGKLINNSQFDQHVAGFAISNSENGQIITSYVAGQSSDSSIYSTDKDSYIISTLEFAGFVYKNAGKISDCYTDIDLSQASSNMAGFVFYNSGDIERSFSMSILRNERAVSAGFARYDTLDGLKGSFSDCYYFYEESQDINTSLVDTTSIGGIERLNTIGFANLTENFENYSYQTDMGTRAIWFFSKDGGQSDTFVDYIPSTDKIIIEGEDGKNQTNTVYDTEKMTFARNRLELISPNISTLSIKNFSYSEVDETSGVTKYYYVDDSSAPNRGSIHNPRLLYNANTMESEILEQTTISGINTSNYRIISDIDYNSYEGLSNLYKVIFAGSIEGNGMKISGVSLASMEKLPSAGLFAQIGYSSSKLGVVKNLTIIPKQVAFTNTTSVGTLAGVLKFGNIYDISVTSNNDSNITVTGTNFVGGVIGKAISSYIIKDITSSVNVSASYLPKADSSYDDSYLSDSEFSYAGGLVGFLGNGTVYASTVSKVTSVMGGRAGFAFGGIGKYASVYYTYVDVPSSSNIKAYLYGGYVTGEVLGNLYYTQVSNNNNIESSFSVTPRTALAVGGITGLLAGGTIDSAVMEQSFRTTTLSSSNGYITSVGGIAGTVSTTTSTTSKISNCIVNAEITAISKLGGAVGEVSSALKIDSVAIKENQLKLTGQVADPILGGIVANVSNMRNSSITISNSYCLADLFVETTTSGVKSTASVGGLIAKTERAPKMYNCYTTSKISAKVYDTRALGEVQDFANYLKEDNTITQTSAPTYSYNIYSNSNIVDVYYYGYGSSSSETSDSGDSGVNVSANSENIVSGGTDDTNGIYNNSYRPSMVTFATKFKSAPMGLIINNYGEDSVNYSKYFGSSRANVITSKSALNNLFGNQFFCSNVKEGTQIIKIDNLTYNYITGNYTFERIIDENSKETIEFVVDASDNQIYRCSSKNLYFNIADLKQVEILRDNNGVDYKVYAKTSDAGMDVIYKNLSTGQELLEDEMSTIPSTKIWKINNGNFSSLVFEENLFWVK